MDYFEESSLKVVVSTSPIETAEVDGIIIACYENLQATDNGAFAKLKDQFTNVLDFTAKEGEVTLLYNIKSIKSPRVVLAGLGSKDKVTAEIVRCVSAKAAKLLRDKSGVKKIAIEAIGGNAQATAEGALLGLYRFEQLKSVKKPTIAELVLSASSSSESDEFQVGVVIARSQNVSRILAELPANWATPTYFCEQAKKLFAGDSKVEVVAHDVAWAEERKMGSFLSVTHGSDEPAKFLEIVYRGSNDANAQPTVFVGKGVTFDSGGISIKPSEGMGAMRGDCGGAAAVIGILLAISKLKLPINVVGLTPLTENMPSGKATKPADVVYASNGKSIEIDNTDAEGRLILADALVYADTFKPHTVIDMATLTGAIGIALGIHFSGAFTNSDALWEEVNKAGYETHERFWRMPLTSDYRKQIDSEIADLKNVGGRQGGSITAAVFLSEFVTTQRWIHLDIAATALGASREPAYLPTGMTGVPVRAMVQWARNLAQK